MISADALGVRLDTRAAVDICRDAIAALAASLPGWVPRNGSLEVMHMEALATEVHAILSGADAILGGLAEQVLSTLYGVPRLAGAPGAGNVALTFSTSTTTVIPTGTMFTLPDIGVDLISTADVTVTAATTATVPVATSIATAAANGLASVGVDVLDVIPNVTTAALSASPITGGYAAESDDEYLARAVARLSRVTSSLTTPDHFAAYALEDGRAVNAACIPAWDYSGTPGAVAGHVSVATYGRGGNLAAGDLTSLATLMQAITAAGITVHVGAATLNPIAVTATVHPLAGWSSTDVRTAVQNALTAYLNPEAWEFGGTVRTTSLISIMAGADGVDYVASMSTPSSDTTLTAAGLASAGTLTITVS